MFTKSHTQRSCWTSPSRLRGGYRSVAPSDSWISRATQQAGPAVAGRGASPQDSPSTLIASVFIIASPWASENKQSVANWGEVVPSVLQKRSFQTGFFCNLDSLPLHIPWGTLKHRYPAWAADEGVCPGLFRGQGQGRQNFGVWIPAMQHWCPLRLDKLGLHSAATGAKAQMKQCLW